jgi:AcrR family transcriptional regulator
MRSDVTSSPFAKGTATRQRILDAAVARFASQGFRDTTVAAVARDAGVTAPAVHQYFGSKQELFHAAFSCDVAPVLEALHGGGGTGPGRALALDSTAAQHGLVPRVAAQFALHPLAMRVLEGSEPEHTADLMALPAVVEAHDRLTRRVAEDQQAGALRDDLPAAALADALETLVFALLLGPVQMSGENSDPGRRWAIAAVISRGIRPR